MPTKQELEQQSAELQAQVKNQEVTAERLATELHDAHGKNKELMQGLETLREEFAAGVAYLRTEREECRKERVCETSRWIVFARS